MIARATRLALALALLAGCNAVLGIEEAHLSQNVGEGSLPNKPVVIPNANCDAPVSDCGSCLSANCAAALDADLTTKPGRDALVTYRACLGTDCADSDEACGEALLESGSELVTCAATDCRDECSASSLASTCKIYCTCMGMNCAGSAALTDCEAQCMGEDLADVGCRLTHCEYSPLSSTPDLHCGHAEGVGQCTGTGSITPTCTDRKIPGWICYDNAECCSGDCNPDTDICN
jgi:hypothetical protein